jgi:hypothetical protein
LALCAAGLPAAAAQERSAAVPIPASAPVPAHPDEALARATARRYQALLPGYRWQLISALDRDGKPYPWFSLGKDAPVFEFTREEASLSAEASLLVHSQLCQRQVDGRLTLRRYQVQGTDSQRDVAWELRLRRASHERRPALTCQEPAYRSELRLEELLSDGHAMRMRVEQAKRDRPLLEVQDRFGGELRFEGRALAEADRLQLQAPELLLQIKEAAAPCKVTWLPGARCLLFRVVSLGAVGAGSATVSDWNDTVLAVDRYTHVAGTEVMLRVKRYGKTTAGSADLPAYRAERLLWMRGPGVAPNMMPSVAGVTAASVLDPDAATFLPTMRARFVSRDRSLTATEFTHLYYGNWLQRALAPGRIDAMSAFPGAEAMEEAVDYLALRRQLHALAQAGTSPADVLKQADAREQGYREFLGSYPLHLNALEDLAKGEGAAGVGEPDVLFVFNGLLNAVLATGDGASCETAYMLTTSADIGVVLRQLSLPRDPKANLKQGDQCVRTGSGQTVKYFTALDMR